MLTEAQNLISFKSCRSLLEGIQMAMEKTILTYTLGSLRFSRTVVQAALKLCCAHKQWPYSCSCRRMQCWCGVDIPPVPGLCTHKLFKQFSHKNRENKNW